MSTQVTFTEKTLKALEELRKGSHYEEFTGFSKDLEDHLLDDEGLYDNEKRCTKTVLLLKTFRFYSGIIIRLLEKGGCDEEE